MIDGVSKRFEIRIGYTTILLICKIFGYPGSVVINLKNGSYKFEFIRVV